MRFLADMGIALDVVTALQAAGHEAIHLINEGLQRLPDEQILAKASSEQRVVLAHDLDFPRILALTGAAGPSVITFRLADMRPPSVLHHLFPVLVTFADELKAGAVITITDFAARCRRLPIGSRPSQ